MKKPNVLFIMCDQMRHDAIRCNGNEFIKTPNLDRLAASGVNFSNAFTPNPICVPARASLTTGCYPHKCTGIKNNVGSIKEGYPLLGEEFNQRGYNTYAIGKLHYSPYQGPGEPRTTHGLQKTELAESGRILSKYDPENKLTGLEDYHDYLHDSGWGGYTRGHGLGNNDVYAAASPIPEEHYVDAWVADRSIDYMQQHIDEKSDQPFFMWASFPKPHSAFDPPHPYDQMYDPRKLPDPVGSFEMIKERGLASHVANYYTFLWHLLSPEAKKVIKAYYYGLISHQDKQVGKLLDFLERNGLRENTIVIYTSDHGEMLGDFGLYFKSNCYNASIRVPLMISYPDKLAKGHQSDELVGLQDLLPTLLSLTGEPLECEIDGQDLSPVLLKQQPVRQYYVAQCLGEPKQQYMVASKEWKYIYHEQGGIEELYQQKHDPNELDNKANSDDPHIAAIQQQMREYLIEWCRNNGDEMMLEAGDLKQSTPIGSLEKPKIPNPFGRRYY